jgi:hypothetical protein
MVTFSEFTTRLSRLGSVATDDGGFLQQLGAALVDRGKVKTWEKPAATGAQKGLLLSRLGACVMDFEQFCIVAHSADENKYKDDTPQWWADIGAKMLNAICEVIDGQNSGQHSAKFTEAEELGRMLTDKEVQEVLAVNTWPELLEALEGDDYPKVQAIVDTSTKWGKLVFRAKTCWDASLGLKVEASDTNRMRLNRALQKLHRLQCKSLNLLHQDTLFSDKEDKIPVAAQLLKTFGSFLGDNSMRSLSQKLIQAMADVLGIDVAELRSRPPTVIRKALAAMLSMLSRSWGTDIGDGTSDRAAAVFDSWAMVDGLFAQYATRHGGAANQGPISFVEQVIFPRIARWLMQFWATLWEAAASTGTLHEFLAPAE